MKKGNTDLLLATPPPEPPVISGITFQQFIAKRLQPLLAICLHIQNRGDGQLILTRPLLGHLLSESSQLEELLDAYGARNNCQWYMLRRLMATCRLFSGTGYKLLHVEHSCPMYRLMPVEENFDEFQEQTVSFIAEVIHKVAISLIEKAKELQLPLPVNEAIPGFTAFLEVLPSGRLPHDRQRRIMQSAQQTIAHVATSYLNLAAESSFLRTAIQTQPDEYAACIPDPISEAELRRLEDRFHTLQSMYDTNISDTETECSDECLPVLRGHISIVFHLLEIAVTLCHHYERHVCHLYHGENNTSTVPLVNEKKLLDALMHFALRFSYLYMEAGRTLCQRMLKRYAEVGKIRVPVPRYRGFHVRPSTLVAKIARHYGSDVKMILDEEEYDAASPLELFRANEKINAFKRRRLAKDIAGLTNEGDRPIVSNQDLSEAVRRIVLLLAEKNKLVIYERPLPVDTCDRTMEKTLSQLAVDEITRLLAMGKIDIEADIEVEFEGDTRVLEDLRLLVEHGYGEDNFGNNIPLPEKLAYLRR